MYSVVDFNSIPKLVGKPDAFLLLKELTFYNPDADWHVVATTTEADPNALERLYALAHQLLKISNVNPVHLTMTLQNIMGEEITYTAARIMIDARSVLDL